MTTTRSPLRTTLIAVIAASALLTACTGSSTTAPAPQTAETVASAIRSALESGPVRVQGFIDTDTSTSAMVDDAAASIARDAEAVAQFNPVAGDSVAGILDENVDAAALDAGLATDEGWNLDTSAGNGATISLMQGGETCTATITVASGSVSVQPSSCSGTQTPSSLTSVPTFTLDVDAAGNVSMLDSSDETISGEYRIIDGGLFSSVPTYRKGVSNERVWVRVNTDALASATEDVPTFPLTLASLQNEIFGFEFADGYMELEDCLSDAKITQIPSVETADTSFSLTCPGQQDPLAVFPALAIRVDLDADGKVRTLVHETTGHRIEYDRTVAVSPIVRPSPVLEGSAASEMILIETFALDAKIYAEAVARDATALAAFDNVPVPTPSHFATALNESGCGADCEYDPNAGMFSQRNDELSVACTVKISATPRSDANSDDPAEISVKIAYCEKQ